MTPAIRSLVAGAAMAASLLGPSAARAADIVDTAVSAGSFKTLVTAVKAAGLVKTLKSKGPFTVFAPNDAAFAKLPPGTVESLLKDKAKLAAVLKYHVIPGRVKAADVFGKSLTVATVQGQPVSVNGNFGVRVNDAHVIQPDIEASNGVIHVIDTVLLPPARAKKMH
ncbi:MAG TPA: fasciclin domain-containing protein [Bradyrhizobium sp.]|nr:fasciclin domain-containing protein [Bradyrhizobium sp.]